MYNSNIPLCSTQQQQYMLVNGKYVESYAFVTLRISNFARQCINIEFIKSKQHERILMEIVNIDEFVPNLYFKCNVNLHICKM